jgi:Fic family protein
MPYNWQDAAWPNFTYDLSGGLRTSMNRYSKEARRLEDTFKQIDSQTQQQILTDLMVTEAIATSAIEKEYFDDADMRCAVRMQLVLSGDQNNIKDLRSIGMAQLMVDSRKAFDETLSADMMFTWHELILSDPLVRKRMTVGNWRTKHVQIVASSMGSRWVVFEAPPPELVPSEMEQFIRWFNYPDPHHGSIKMRGPVRSALSHLYFESIHPFDDGNGRVWRVLAEKALSQELNSPVLFSLSQIILARQSEYYKQLSCASRGDMTVTAWMEFFVAAVLQAQTEAAQKITSALQKID